MSLLHAGWNILQTFVVLLVCFSIQTTCFIFYHISEYFQRAESFLISEWLLLSQIPHILWRWKINYWFRSAYHWSQSWANLMQSTLSHLHYSFPAGLFSSFFPAKNLYLCISSLLHMPHAASFSYRFYCNTWILPSWKSQLSTVLHTAQVQIISLPLDWVWSLVTEGYAFVPHCKFPGTAVCHTSCRI